MMKNINQNYITIIKDALKAFIFRMNSFTDTQISNLTMLGPTIQLMTLGIKLIILFYINPYTATILILKE